MKSSGEDKINETRSRVDPVLPLYVFQRLKSQWMEVDKFVMPETQWMVLCSSQQEDLCLLLSLKCCGTQLITHTGTNLLSTRKEKKTKTTDNSICLTSAM